MSKDEPRHGLEFYGKWHVYRRIKQLERALFRIMTNCDDSNFDVYAEAEKALEATDADT